MDDMKIITSRDILIEVADALAAKDAEIAALKAEPNMRHPKIQSLIGGKARVEIELRLVEQLLEDPDFDTTALDMEYWSTLHDQLKEALCSIPKKDAEISRLTADLDEWRFTNRVDELGRHVDRLTAENARLRAENAALRAENAKLHGWYNDAEQRLARELKGTI